jgi:hypothetical protein
MTLFKPSTYTMKQLKVTGNATVSSDDDKINIFVSSSSLANATGTGSALLNSSLIQIKQLNIVEGNNPPTVFDVSGVGNQTYANPVRTT